MSAKKTQAGFIRVRGARQNNLRGIDVDVPVGSFTVVTGVSGSGKSSLVFDTVYAEGQRRYVETFSPYARQFLERLPPPLVDSVDGLPPAIAIRQGNPVRNSRSTVGTMTELADSFKQLFASCARPFCPHCGKEVVPATVASVLADLRRRGLASRRVVVAFEVGVPASVSRDEALSLLSSQGWTRVCDAPGGALRVSVDAVRVPAEGAAARFAEALETAFAKGGGAALVVPLAEDRSEGGPLRYRSSLECPDCGHVFEKPSPNLFSFNSPVGACPKCRGFGRVIGVSEALVVPDPGLSVGQGCLKPFQTASFDMVQRGLVRRAKKIGFPLDVPWRDLPPERKKWIWEGETDDWESGLWPGVSEFFRWLESRSYKLHVRVMLSRYREYAPCPACGGARLRPAALDWKVVAGGEALDVPSLSARTVSGARRFLETLASGCRPGTPRGDAALAVLDGALPRLRYLEEAGVGYLGLDRQSRTLSGGEAQRIALTTALGSDLVGTLFVLDEPSVGLHPADTGRLVALLRRLRDAGNTVLVVEHDPAVILAADRVIELGPGPGERGGSVVFDGTVPQLLRSKASVTAPWLARHVAEGKKASGAVRPPSGARRAAARGPAASAALPEAAEPAAAWDSPARRPRLRLLGASEHNLQDVDAEFPLGAITVVTGVSGSGKSTLVCDVLYPAVRRALGLPAPECGAFRALEGAEAFASVEMVDQTPIGKSARSTPASFVGAFDAIRKVFAASPEAKARGLGVGDFSFNSGLGRCPACEGSGFEHVEMQFLSDVYLPCEACGGSRYREETLAVKVPRADGAGALSVADALRLTVEDAAAAFADVPEVVAALRPLADAGLGYLRLGQPVPTLSGGESQRLKLAGFLAALDEKRGASGRAARKPSLLLFDEPTTGLHFGDIDALLKVMRRLAGEGHALVVVEHNLQVMRAADWMVDLGPGGGADGGRVVASGPPALVAATSSGATAAALRG